jgi:hypothetical protein
MTAKKPAMLRALPVYNRLSNYVTSSGKMSKEPVFIIYHKNLLKVCKKKYTLKRFSIKC